VEMAPKAGKDLGGLRWIMMKNLKKLGAAVKTGAAVKMAVRGCLMVSEKKVVAEGMEPADVISKIPCDLLVIAAGNRPRGTLGLENILKNAGVGYTVLGDGNGTGNIMNGLKEAWEAAR